jgi:nucleotide-binding universal stress UspA family protein
VDGSAFAAHASDAGLDLAHQLGAEIAFVTIVDPAMTQVAPDSGIRWSGG